MWTEIKVLFEDWRDIVRDEAVFCLLCRHQAESGDWNTPEQDEQIQQEALRYEHGQLNASFSSAARSFNRSQPRGGLIEHVHELPSIFTARGGASWRVGCPAADRSSA